MSEQKCRRNDKTRAGRFTTLSFVVSLTLILVLSGCDFWQWMYGDATILIINTTATPITRVTLYHGTRVVAENATELAPGKSWELSGLSRDQYRLDGDFADDATFSVDIDIRNLERFTVEVGYDQ